MPTRNGAHTMQIALHREKTANFPLWCAPPSSLFEVDKTIPKHRNKICKGCLSSGSGVTTITRSKNNKIRHEGGQL